MNATRFKNLQGVVGIDIATLGAFLEDICVYANIILWRQGGGGALLSQDIPPRLASTAWQTAASPQVSVLPGKEARYLAGRSHYKNGDWAAETAEALCMTRKQWQALSSGDGLQAVGMSEWPGTALLDGDGTVSSKLSLMLQAEGSNPTVATVALAVTSTKGDLAGLTGELVHSASRRSPPSKRSGRAAVHTGMARRPVRRLSPRCC